MDMNLRTQEYPTIDCLLKERMMVWKNIVIAWYYV